MSETRPEPTSVVFLDVDGVLLPERGSEQNQLRMKFNEQAMELIVKLAKAAFASIVLSSEWRLGDTLAQAKESMKQYGASEELLDLIVDRTPVDGAGRFRYKQSKLVKPENIPKIMRNGEINQYLADNSVGKYIIIDDITQELFSQDNRERLVRVDAAVGFTEENYQDALDKFEAQRVNLEPTNSAVSLTPPQS
ncbi:HAD domain-containing protein [Candidatus Saccharibacteria bacterium]|nr:HAD domain-containing protein [Candidatus Saccharibacteria bacterium]